MRWHGFLTRFMLFAAAALHAFQAGWILSGKIYYTEQIRAQVYAGIPGLRFADWGLAACLIVAALLQLVARSRLAKKRASGVKVLLAAYGLLALAQIAYAAARLLIAGLGPFSIPVLAQTAAYAALLLANRAYYARRPGVLDGKE